MIKIFIFFCLFFSPFLWGGIGSEVFCQNQPIQDSVYNLMIDFFRSKSEAGKIETSKRFSNGLKVALNMEKSIEFAFDSLKKYKVMIEAPDKQVRIFTWDVEADDGTHSYHGFIQSFNKKEKKFIVHQLQDKSEGVKDPENMVLDNLKWYGAYYYQIVLVKHKRKKYYTLLGWDGNNRITNKRLVDVLYFTDKGFPKFGDAIFVSENGKIKKRLVFEYKAGIFMSLKYEPERDAIIFDHLSPSEPHLEGMYSFYGPDFTYDMLEFKEGRWQYVKNVQGGNDKNKADKHWNSPK